jgi:hypothetical protein
MLSALGFRSYPASAWLTCLWSRQFLLYDYEGLANFVQNRLEVGGQDYLLRIDYHVYTGPRHRPTHANGLAETPFHAVPLNRPTKSSPDRKSDAQTGLASTRICWLSLPIKHGHRSRKMATTLLVDTLEVGVPQ